MGKIKKLYGVDLIRSVDFVGQKVMWWIETMIIVKQIKISLINQMLRNNIFQKIQLKKIKLKY